MSIYYISGLSGTGKSTIQAELEKLGFETIDTDKEWGYYGIVATGEPMSRPENAPAEWFVDKGFIWNVPKVRAVLSTPRHRPLFVCGGSRNEDKFYDLFERIFVLHLPDDILRARLGSRDKSRLMTDPTFIDRMVRYNQRDVYEHARLVDGVVIETTQSLADCVRQILDVVKVNA